MTVQKGSSGVVWEGGGSNGRGVGHRRAEPGGDVTIIAILTRAQNLPATDREVGEWEGKRMNGKKDTKKERKGKEK